MKTLERLFEYSFTLEHLALFRQLGELKERQKEIEGKLGVMDSIRQMSLLESIEFSSQIDGVVVNRSTIQKLFLKEIKPSTATESQAVGYADSLKIVTEPAENALLTVEFIKELHKTLYGYLPKKGGRWRATNKDIVERNRHGSIKGVLYHTTLAVNIGSTIESAVELFNSQLKNGVEPVLLISAMVLDFICIHPFSEGNGRISRLLILLMLSLCGYRIGELISIERIIFQNKDKYNQALRSSVHGWDKGEHDPLPWIDFFLNIVITAYSDLYEKVATLSYNGMRAPKTQLIRTAVHQVKGPFSVADVCIQIPTVSRELVKKVIQQLRDEGILKPIGKGRGAQWQQAG